MQCSFLNMLTEKVSMDTGNVHSIVKIHYLVGLNEELSKFIFLSFYIMLENVVRICLDGDPKQPYQLFGHD